MNDTIASTAAAPPSEDGPIVLEGHLADCMAHVDQAKAAHDATEPPGLLSPRAKRAMAKLPQKGIPQVTGLAQLWSRYGGPLQGVDLSRMHEKLAHAEQVREVWSAVMLLAKSLDDDAFVAESAAWTEATQVYTILMTLARTNATLRVALEPYAEYFAEGAETYRKNQADGVPTARQRRKHRVAARAIAAAEALGVAPPVKPA